jgi:hypothetical protein
VSEFGFFVNFPTRTTSTANWDTYFTSFSFWAVLALLPALLQGILHGADEVAGGREALLAQELQALGALCGAAPSSAS